MLFTFSAGPDFDFMTHFARHIGEKVENGLLNIPDSLGQGYIRKISFGPDFKITLHSYTLKEELVIKRKNGGTGHDLLTIFFYNNEQILEIAFDDKPQVRFSQRDDSAIQVTSNDLSSTIRFPAHHVVHYVVVAIRPPYLKSLLALQQPKAIFDTITGQGNSFLFFESMTVETKQILKNIAAVNVNEPLGHFSMHIKVQELLYLLFHQLSARESTTHLSINSVDAERLLHIRNEVISDLSVPPILSELSQIAMMSETKLKQLFKQTFGSTIYNYFQQARMEEAAFLLKQGTHSVAEVGYELGFTNLSHFSRLFEKYYGLNPKKYSYLS